MKLRHNMDSLCNKKLLVIIVMLGWSGNTIGPTLLSAITLLSKGGLIEYPSKILVKCQAHLETLRAFFRNGVQGRYIGRNLLMINLTLSGLNRTGSFSLRQVKSRTLLPVTVNPTTVRHVNMYRYQTRISIHPDPPKSRRMQICQ